MRQTPFALIAVALALGAAGCGSGNKSAATRSVAEAKGSPAESVRTGAAGTVNGLLHGDGDVDPAGNSASGYSDADDRAMLDRGRPAGAADARAIATLIERYYQAAAHEDAAKACALTFSELAESLPEDFAHAAGPPYLRGARTCVEVLSRMFKRFHSQLSAPVTVGAAHVQGKLAYVLLVSPAMPASITEVKRELGKWKMDRVFPLTLP